MVTLNRKEQKRLMVLNQMEVGWMRGMEATEVLGLSLPHLRRILAAYTKQCFVKLIPRRFPLRCLYRPLAKSIKA